MNKLLPLVLLYAASVLAQDAPAAHSITLKGRVIDLRTGEPLAKALVSIRTQNLQTVTDEKGRFELAGVAPGEVELYVSTIDYGLLKQRIQVDAGENAELELLLGQEALKRNERITVTSGPFAPVQPEAPVEHSITNTELKNLSSVMLDDPIRAVQSVPGVAADNDWYAQFAVRGSGPAQIGVFVDGAPMTAPFHEILDDRGNSCSIGLLDNGFVDSMALLSGNFPAQYGDFTGSILDVESREGNADRVSYRADVSLVAASFSAEGPLGASKKATWLVSARKDYVSLIIGRNNGLGLSFYDVHGDLTYSPTEHNRISFSAIHGETDISKDTNSVFGTDGLKDGSSRSELASLRWTWSDASTLSQAQLYGSSDSERDKDLALDLLERSSGGETGFREDVTRQTGDWNKFQAGAIFRLLDRDYLKNEPWDYATEQFSDVLLQTALFSKSASQYGAYVQDTISLADKRAILVLGGRWDRFSHNGENTFLPRVSLSVSPLCGAKLTAAAGQYSQFPDLVELYGEFGTPTLRPELSTQFSLAVEQSLGERIRLRVEGYDRQLRDGIYSAESEFRAAGPGGPVLYPQLGPILANSLRGYSRGLEFTLQRRSANRLTGWISYALGYARSVDTTTNAHFWSDFDQRHTVNIFGSYRLSKSVNLSSNARYGSGFPVVGYLGTPIIQGNAYFPIVSVRNGTRMPPYFRLDTRVNKAFDRKRFKTTLYAEVSDLTNHANYYYWGFVPDYVQYGYIAAGRGTFLKIIPSVGVSVEF
ncbi:MAG: TonB-dependent receptor [Bryobacteraceae bacterium]